MLKLITQATTPDNFRAGVSLHARLLVPLVFSVPRCLPFFLSSFSGLYPGSLPGFAHQVHPSSTSSGSWHVSRWPKF